MECPGEVAAAADANTMALDCNFKFPLLKHISKGACVPQLGERFIQLARLSLSNTKLANPFKGAEIDCPTSVQANWRDCLPGRAGLLVD